MMKGDSDCTHGNVINAALTVVVLTAARMGRRVSFMLKERCFVERGLMKYSGRNL